MSLILEALRRSEAERRRGMAPGLLDEPISVRPRRRRVWPVALAGLLAGLGLAGGVAWWFIGHPAPAASSTPDRSATPDTTAAPAAPTALPTFVPAPLPSPDPAIDRQTNPVATVRMAPAPPEAPVDAPLPAVPPPPNPSTLAAPPREALDLALLPADQRAALPPLRVSMHVFAEDPARRFAIIDGQRLRENDRIAEGLHLAEIQRDGLRLDWSGRPLWLAR